MAPFGLAPATAAGSRTGISVLWPITVVGGCIAVAALGIFGLYSTGSSERGLLAQAATTISPSNLSLDSGFIQPTNSSGGTKLFGSDDSIGQTTTTTSSVPGHLGSDSAPTTTTLAPTTTTTATTSTTVRNPAPSESGAWPAIYSKANLKAGPLASFFVADGMALTSASAVDGYHRVMLRVDGRWIGATIGQSDLFSDVAIVIPSVPLDELGVPTVITGRPVQNGFKVFVGYCSADMELLNNPDAVTPPGCGSVVLPEVAAGVENWDPAIDADEDGASPDGWIAPDSEGAEEAQDGDRDGADSDSSAPESPKPHAASRAGDVWDTDQPARSQADVMIYEPIHTAIATSRGVAGSPLRNHDGKIVGLVMDHDSPTVAAVPIDRVLAVAAALEEFGVGGRTLSGFQVRNSPDGIIIVDTVDDAGPAAPALQVGDVIRSFDGQPVTKGDYLVHLIRQTVPGQVVTLIVERDGQLLELTLTMSSRSN